MENKKEFELLNKYDINGKSVREIVEYLKKNGLSQQKAEIAVRIYLNERVAPNYTEDGYLFEINRRPIK